MKKSLYISLITIIAVFGFDLLTKEIIREKVSRYEVIEVVPNFMNIVHVKNKGGVFGILRNVKGAGKFLTLVSIIVLGFLIYLIATSWKKKFELINLSMIMGGALGNIYERIVRGYVTDFIDVYVKKYHWPAFNVADIFITLGICLLVLKTLLPARSIPES